MINEGTVTPNQETSQQAFAVLLDGETDGFTQPFGIDSDLVPAGKRKRLRNQRNDCQLSLF